MIHKTKQYRRFQRRNHIAKRKKICNNHMTFATYPSEDGKHMISDFSREVPMEWYKHDGQYNKGKIHCSCKMCKFSRHFGLPTLRDIREKQKFEAHLNDYLQSA